MPDDNGTFQINDIVLNIPPQQISIDRQSTVHQWQTIRTRSSIKSNAGFSKIGITVKAIFTSHSGEKTNGFEQLRDIISQLRVTPFCYVENQLLRNSILGGSQEPSMVLALSQVQVIKDNETTNAIFVIFRFFWFNYFPFLPEWTYKQDFLSPVSVKNPAKSLPWKTLYRAEQQKLYKSSSSRQQNKKYGVAPDKLTGKFALTYTEFATFLITKEFNDLKKDVARLEELYMQVANESLGSSEQPYAVAAKFVKSNLVHGEETWNEIKQSLGNTTSQGENLGPGSNLAAAIARVISPNNLDSRYAPVTTYHPVNTGDGKTIFHKPNMSASPQDSNGKDDSILVQRQRGIDFEDKGLIVTGITISFENILAELPLVGYAYPTYQHIGSIDAVVNISMVTTSGYGVSALSSFYNAIEEQSMKYRQVPQGHRNVSINNEIINMCGLRDFIPISMNMDTVEGQAGTYQAVLTLIDNPLDAETQEKIVPASGFLTDSDLRNKTSDILLEKLKLRDDIIDKDTINSDFVKLLEFKEISSYRHTFGLTGLLSQKERQAIVRTGQIAIKDINPEGRGNSPLQSIGLQSIDRLINGFYEYIASGIKDTDNRNEEFRKLCIEYGKRLGFFWLEIANILQKAKRSGVSELYEYVQKYFFSLSDSRAPAIRRIQEDVRVITDKQKVSLQSVKDLNKDYKKSVDQGRVAFDKFNNLGIPDKPAAQLKLEDKDKHIKSIDNAVNEWTRWSQRFLDRIILDGTVQELEQFKSVKKALEERTVTNHGVGCYPDFPLDTVADIIENSTDESFKNVAREIRETTQKIDPMLHQVGLGVLLQPDFYMYNRQIDDIDKIIPESMVSRATDIIQSNQNSKTKEEESWLKDIYEAHVLDENTAKQIKEDVLRFNLDKSSWDSDEGKLVKSKFPQVAEQVTFHPNTLNDDGAGLGCTILEYEENQKENIKLPRVNKEFVDEKGKMSGWLIKETVPGVVTHKVRNEDQTTMKAKRGHHDKIKHHFNADSISLNPEIVQTQDKIDSSTKESILDVERNVFADEIEWVRPVNDDWWITSLFGKRVLNGKFGNRIVRNKEGFHTGIDFAAGTKESTDGGPIFAAATGIIKSIQRDINGLGNSILIQHKDRQGQLTDFYSNYKHLKSGGTTEATMRDYENGKVNVRAGQHIADCGSTGYSSNPHLHFEITGQGGITKRGNNYVNPISIESFRRALLTNRSWGNHEALVTEAAYRQLTRDTSSKATGRTETENILTKSVEQLEKDLQNGQGYSLLRAYPTFKLYFIESDLGERKRFGFDDFFQYSSVESITHIRSRKIAADMVILNITNVSGVLSNRRFRDSVELDDSGKERSSSNTAKDSFGRTVRENENRPGDTNTANENPIASLMLQPGIQVQLRLGYSNHPNDLETVFNGVITDVKFTEHDDMAQVTCQSFAIELVQNYHGQAKTFGGFLSGKGITGELIEELLAVPEVAHFGRWEGSDAENPAYNILKREWKPVPEPYDDNIFAPTPGKGLYGLFDSSVRYVLYQNTVWDVLQEMTLRHPSYVASAVPYKGLSGARMTMFFGVPDQLYFSRDPTFKEEKELRKLTEVVNQTSNDLRNNRSTIDIASDPSVDVQPSTIDELNKEKTIGKESGGLKEARKFWLKNRIKNMALDSGYIKPFRNYHIATSTQHIIANNIESSSNVFNTVTLQYSDSGMFGGGGAEIDESLGQLKFGDLETFTLKSDAAIYDEEVREMFAQYENCVGYEMAKQYCVGLLFYSLKECYRGELIIIGNPKIRPYDLVYIFDEYTDMFGPIEVEQVVHRFSQRHGFITEITPDMVVHVNQHTTMSSSDCMGLIAETALKRIGLQSLSGPAGSAALGAAGAAGLLAAGLAPGAALLGGIGIAADLVFSPIANMFFNSSETSLGQGGSSVVGLVGSFIFSKLITRTQLAHPFRFSPLVKHGRPMTGALPTKKTKGSFLQSIDGWVREAKEGVGIMLVDMYEKYNPNNWWGKSQGDWETVFKGE